MSLKMNIVNAEAILNEVTQFYLNSDDFNGIPTSALAGRFGVEWHELRERLCQLIKEDLAGIIYEETDLNPHIIRRGFAEKESQIKKLTSEASIHACVYPRPKHLELIVNRSKFEGQPYKLCLALGEPQLAYRSFDLSVLEFYRNDPRYFYENDDVRGRICYKSEKLQGGDRIFMQTFGFSYDEDLNRAVAVFLRYLADLSPEHQLIWQAKEIQGDYKLHPDYYRNAVIGDWGEGVPICKAFLKELYIINLMAKTMGRPPLFHQDFGEYGENRPLRFGFLIRPTLEEFNSFVLLLDKMVSENINKEFFQNEVLYETEIHRKDGKIEVQNKGTLQILDDWIRKYFNTDDWEPWEKGIQTLRKVRKMRQKPAHVIHENIFDQRYFKEQQELIIEAYSAVKTLRLFFESHPVVKSGNIDVPVWLREGRIWTR
jgi:hypothetical protein